MFTIVVATAPTEETALVYEIQLKELRNQLPCLRNCKLLACIPDPKGRRIGSGGGTLNALDALKNKLGKDALIKEKILMIHSGGDSRRSPTHSVIGKAWSSINCTLEQGNVATPMALLITELSLYCYSLQLGSLVIASSDVMLDLCCNPNDHVQFCGDCVTVLAVPEICEISKNHGVLVPDVIDEFGNAFARHYLQKPSIQLMEDKHASFSSFLRDEEKIVYAWIDTGVVCFSGTAYDAILKLTDYEVIQTMFSSHDELSSLRIELYTEILLACATTENNTDISSFFQRLHVDINSEAEETDFLKALKVIHHEFGTISLKTKCISNGIFAHLGTTVELRNLLFSAFGGKSITITSLDKTSSLFKKFCRLSEKYNLRGNISMFARSDRKIHESNSIGICSYLAESSDCNSEAVIEYSIISNAHIGAMSVVSHVDQHFGNGLSVSSHVMIQQVSLQKIFVVPAPVSYMYDAYSLLVLGISDDTKTEFKDDNATICGQKWVIFMQKASLISVDIWGEDHSDNTLWTARLFPIVYRFHDGSSGLLQQDNTIKINELSMIRNACTWFQDVDNAIMSDIELWRQSRRYSLRDLLHYGSALNMHKWRCLTSTLSRSSIILSLELSDASVEKHIEKFFLNHLHTIADIKRLLEHLIPSDTLHPMSDNFLTTRAHQYLFSLWCLRTALKKNISFVERNEFSKCAKSMIQQLLLLQDNIDIVRISDRSSANNCMELIVYSMNYLWDTSNARECYDTLIYLRNSAGALDHLFTQCLIYGYTTLLKITMVGDIIKNAANSSTKRSFKKKYENSGYYYFLRRAVYDCLNSMMDALAIDENELFQRQSSLTVSLSLDDIAQIYISSHVAYSLDNDYQSNAIDDSVVVKNFNNVSISSAPARIDIVGGWSDTPPICYESGGAVFNVAVKVNGYRPLICCCRFTEHPHIVLRTLMLQETKVVVGEEKIIKIKEYIVPDAGDTIDPQSQCALLYACIVLCELPQWLCLTDVGGVEICSFSALPAGSGMGGSSILAAVIIQAVLELMNRCCSLELLQRMASKAEQILTTGGGWQDQIGGIYGGFKLGYCNPGLPSEINVKQHFTANNAPSSLGRILFEKFNTRCCLVYTGHQRLAKNTLINALRSNALSPYTPYNATLALQSGESIKFQQKENALIGALITHALKISKLLTEFEGSVDRYPEADFKLADQIIGNIAASLNIYWALKREMASGSEPEHLKALRESLEDICSGWALCGAGGGGYAVIILNESITQDDLKNRINQINSAREVCFSTDKADQKSLFSVHSVSVEHKGISAKKIQLDANIDMCSFLDDCLSDVSFFS